MPEGTCNRLWTSWYKLKRWLREVKQNVKNQRNKMRQTSKTEFNDRKSC